MIKTGIILQARMGSTRLPEKMVIPFFENMGLLQTLISRLIGRFGESNIVLATTTSVEDDSIHWIGKELGIKVFRGEEHNVLNRFIEAAEKFKYKNVVRVCCDNPFLQMGSIDQVLNELNDENFDYVSFKVNSKPAILTHFGFWVEGVTLKALKKIKESTDDPVYLEHVTNYIHSGSPESFNIKWIKSNSCKITDSESVRLTMDTEKDFVLLKQIFNELWNGEESDISPENLWYYLQNNRSLMEEMSLEIKANLK